MTLSSSYTVKIPSSSFTIKISPSPTAVKISPSPFTAKMSPSPFIDKMSLSPSIVTISLFMIKISPLPLTVLSSSVWLKVEIVGLKAILFKILSLASVSFVRKCEARWQSHKLLLSSVELTLGIFFCRACLRDFFDYPVTCYH